MPVHHVLQDCSSAWQPRVIRRAAPLTVPARHAAGFRTVLLRKQEHLSLLGFLRQGARAIAMLVAPRRMMRAEEDAADNDVDDATLMLEREVRPKRPERCARRRENAARRDFCAGLPLRRIVQREADSGDARRAGRRSHAAAPEAQHAAVGWGGGPRGRRAPGAEEGPGGGAAARGAQQGAAARGAARGASAVAGDHWPRGARARAAPPHALGHRCPGRGCRRRLLPVNARWRGLQSVRWDGLSSKEVGCALIHNCTASQLQPQFCTGLRIYKAAAGP